MKHKILSGIILIFVSLLYTSCTWFNKELITPHIVGTGTVAKDSTSYYVMIKDTRYNLTKVKTGTRTFLKENTQTPYVNQKVTGYYLNNDTTMLFQAGHLTHQQIQQFYPYNSKTMLLSIIGLLVLSLSVKLIAERYTKQIKE